MGVRCTKSNTFAQNQSASKFWVAMTASCYFLSIPSSSLNDPVPRALARKRELDRRLNKYVRTESAAALKTVHELIATFGFTAQQVFPFQPVQKKKVQAKYYDPETGLSWTGRGEAPSGSRAKTAQPMKLLRRAPSPPASLRAEPGTAATPSPSSKRQRGFQQKTLPVSSTGRVSFVGSGWLGGVRLKAVWASLAGAAG